MHPRAALAHDASPSSLAAEILTALAGLGQTAVPSRVTRGDLISLQDGRGRGVHVLSQGRVKILRFSDEGRVILLDLVDPGDVFGELAFLSSMDEDESASTESLLDGGQPSYAEALEDSVIHSIPHVTFERLLRARPGLALRVASLLGSRCMKLERRLEAHVFQRVPTRLANQLIELAERFGVPDGQGMVLSIPLSQQDLGNLIGASREIVSLTLSDFKRRGLVSSKGRRLILHQDRLRRETPSLG